MCILTYQILGFNSLIFFDFLSAQILLFPFLFHRKTRLLKEISTALQIGDATVKFELQNVHDDTSGVESKNAFRSDTSENRNARALVNATQVKRALRLFRKISDVACNSSRNTRKRYGRTRLTRSFLNHETKNQNVYANHFTVTTLIIINTILRKIAMKSNVTLHSNSILYPLLSHMHFGTCYTAWWTILIS